MQTNEERHMQAAIDAAEAAGTPYGALLLQPGSGRSVALGNSVNDSADPTAHAEVNVLREAGRRGIATPCSVLYSTCEPCPMCAMAAVWAGVTHIYYGATIDDAAVHGNQVKIYCREVAEKAWYDLSVQGGILSRECRQLFGK